jgi:hypothetical protein
MSRPGVVSTMTIEVQSKLPECLLQLQRVKGKVQVMLISANPNQFSLCACCTCCTRLRRGVGGLLV